MSEPLSAKEFLLSRGITDERMTLPEAEAFAQIRVRAFAKRAARFAGKKCMGRCDYPGDDCFDCIAAKIRALAGKE